MGGSWGGVLNGPADGPDSGRSSRLRIPEAPTPSGPVEIVRLPLIGSKFGKMVATYVTFAGLLVTTGASEAA